MKAGKPAFVEEEFLTFDEARRLVLELGGIPSYPVLADGASPMCQFEADPDQLIRELQSRNVHAAEWIPIRNVHALLLDYVPKMRAAGLAVTAGTEHNTLDLMRLRPVLQGRRRCRRHSRDLLGRRVRRCRTPVLSLHGECGYVDAHGRPNPGYDSADARIKHLARIGAAVIQRYCDTWQQSNKGSG